MLDKQKNDMLATANGGGRHENQLDKKPIESVDFQQDKPIKKTLSITLGGGDF